MKIFNLPRGKGKTMRMLYASEYHNAPILCCDEANKKRIMDMAHWLDINIPEPITAHDITNYKTRGKHINDIVVDDMDCVFRALLSSEYHLNMVAGTITIDKEVSNG